MDYRDIPSTKFDKITCLEMAEHVGVRKFQSFLAQVRDMLEDDGIFFLQIAGLRQTWQWEGFISGLTVYLPGCGRQLSTGVDCHRVWKFKNAANLKLFLAFGFCVSRI